MNGLFLSGYFDYITAFFTSLGENFASITTNISSEGHAIDYLRLFTVFSVWSMAADAIFQQFLGNARAREEDKKLQQTRLARGGDDSDSDDEWWMELLEGDEDGEDQDLIDRVST